MLDVPPLPSEVLPGGIRSRFVSDVPGRTIDVPSIFISGKSDWGVYQRAGAVERMQNAACTRMVGCHLLDGAGHWVQQEQAAAVSHLLLEFLKGQEGTRD